MDLALTESERGVLGRIFRHGPMTQGQMSAETGLTQQSASRIVNRLTEAGYLVESERVATGRRGYPSASFRLDEKAAFAFGFSLTHDAGTATLVNFAGNVVAERRKAFPTMSQANVVEWLDESIAALRSENLAAGAHVAGLGVAVAGSHIGADEAAGYNTPFELEDWAGIDIAALLSARLGMPVWTDNNGNLATFAEAKIGVGRWANSFAYLYIGAGVGGGVVLDGELWRGRNGNAGEFAGGLPPNIYPFPNLELLRQLVVGQGAAFASVHEMVEHFDPQWPAIAEWIARVRDSVSIIASNATAILDVDLIVLGGEMPRALAELLIPSIALFDQKRRSVARPTARIVPAEASGDAAALGAAILPFQKTLFRREPSVAR